MKMKIQTHRHMHALVGELAREGAKEGTGAEAGDEEHADLPFAELVELIQRVHVRPCDTNISLCVYIYVYICIYIYIYIYIYICTPTRPTEVAKVS